MLLSTRRTGGGGGGVNRVVVVVLFFVLMMTMMMMMMLSTRRVVQAFVPSTLMRTTTTTTATATTRRMTSRSLLSSYHLTTSSTQSSSSTSSTQSSSTASRMTTTRLFQSSSSSKETTEDAATKTTGTTNEEEAAATATTNQATTSSSSTSPLTTPLRRVKTVDAVAPTPNQESIIVKGWVRTVRKQKTLAFVEVNDGSNLAGIQCVVVFDNVSAETRQQLEQHVTTGCAVEVTGPLVKSQGGKQAVEVAATRLRVVGPCPADTYPLAKKRHTLEYLRSIAHLRPRTNTLAAVARVRSQVAAAIHLFFQQAGFVYVQTPLITASDCEGAGEMFRVTSFNLDDLSQIPVVGPKKNTTAAVSSSSSSSSNQKASNPPPTPRADFTQDFFSKPAYLTVSGQLGAETYACALGDVYTFGPTFRAENSQTTRHLAEFHMVEPEMAFADLPAAMDNAEAMLKFVVQHILQHCPEDLQFFTKFYDKKLQQRLEQLVAQPFARVSYRQAIAYLQDEIAKDPSQWQFPDVEFGTDLATEHERWLAESKFDSAVFVYNYPKSIKAFYMRDNDEDGGETVNAMDLLVPGVGELVGGSQREERLDVLTRKMEELDLDPAEYWWYLDLRRYGSVPHAGYGLGFERLVTYVCGIENIREAIAFPRYPGNAEF